MAQALHCPSSLTSNLKSEGSAPTTEPAPAARHPSPIRRSSARTSHSPTSKSPRVWSMAPANSPRSTTPTTRCKRSPLASSFTSGSGLHPSPRVAKRSKPLSKICCEQRGFFHRSKVPAAWHLGPPLHVEEPLRPFAWWLTDVFRKERKRGRNLRRAGPFFDALCDPRYGAGIRVIVVGQKRRANRFRRPIDHDVRQDFVFAKPRFNPATAIAPGFEFLHYPCSQPNGRIVQSRSKTLRLCRLDESVGAFFLHPLFILSKKLLLSGRWIVRLLKDVSERNIGEMNCGNDIGVVTRELLGHRAAPISSMRSEPPVA